MGLTTQRKTVCYEISQRASDLDGFFDKRPKLRKNGYGRVAYDSCGRNGYDEVVRTKGSVESSCDHGHELFGFHKMLVNSSVAERLAASQERLSSMG
jgi:hypothetical protein